MFFILSDEWNTAYLHLFPATCSSTTLDSMSSKISFLPSIVHISFLWRVHLKSLWHSVNTPLLINRETAPRGFWEPTSLLISPGPTTPMPCWGQPNSGCTFSFQPGPEAAAGNLPLVSGERAHTVYCVGVWYVGSIAEKMKAIKSLAALCPA